ncbi:NAD(P)H-hydrate dehydratase [Helicobacter sp. 13S00477-4]|uniref:NAD(P)H-hydrate dehydratase n=1 Tax=Helicobacter sp. 13S00477-4 TaxID=1905759 RepID=UPI000BA58F8C|nr:NAD(P)H-hydrate dehydratase [Helicobacter sp. 13S00477-4]PAF52116.1 bifunctional ADP-dependent (S)-NAD(P)H-hydrate dehydratase/NAD(P)H-hydrate epimerase [Helicobacter sp. 13S00477-4]
MQNIYESLEILDKRAIEKYSLNEDLLMENAANAMKQLVAKITHYGSMIIIVCGGGDNGGDGYALARQLAGDYNVKLFIVKEPKTQMCQVQYHRAMEIGIEVIKKILPCDVIVDCLFGSGFVGEILPDMKKNIFAMNEVGRIKIACDIPSGIDKNGNINDIAFKADWTVSMGALKIALFSDMAKDYIGKIIVGDLGIGRRFYEITSNTQMLQKTDMILPLRRQANVHKGTFGHLCVYVGEKSGAGLLAAMSGMAFGAGVVSVIGNGFDKPIELIHATDIPDNATAFVVGMGMGAVPKNLYSMLDKAPCVIDADLFYYADFEYILLNYQNLVLTPHPKEFLSVLKILGFGEIDLSEFLKNKINILREFTIKYPKIVVLLKGANTMIAKNNKIYINIFGTANLAKGGSGDVLSGMIGALLAQGYTPLDATISASLAHSFAANLEKTNYGLTPLKLIENIKNIS